MKSDTVRNNEEELRDAVINGVSGDAVSATVEDVIVKSDNLGNTPNQVKDVFDVIIGMKETPNVPSKAYMSSYVNTNIEKIRSALENGISPEEIAKSLNNHLKVSNTRQGKKNLKFITKLISKIKKKEKSLALQNTSSKQKVKTNGSF